MKLPLSTTVSTVPPYRRLTAVKAITATVLQNVRRLTATTAGTERRFRCRPTLTVPPTIPTALPNVPPGAVTQVIHSQEARALKTTPVTTVRRLFQVVQATQAALTSQIVRPKSAPGLVTQDIKSQEILV